MMTTTRTKTRNRVAFAAAALALPALVLAQNPPAPRGNPSATVGGKKVSVEYGQPALNQRTIKDLLAQLPKDRVWRAGTNQVTTLTTEGDIAIGGQKVKAGKYSLYVLAPESGDWSLLVNSDPGVPLKTIFAGAPPAIADALWPRLGPDAYEKIKATEVARAPLKSGKVAATELFTITLTPAGDGATLTLAWGDQSWSTAVTAAK